MRVCVCVCVRVRARTSVCVNVLKCVKPNKATRLIWRRRLLKKARSEKQHINNGKEKKMKWFEWKFIKIIRKKNEEESNEQKTSPVEICNSIFLWWRQKTVEPQVENKV